MSETLLRLVRWVRTAGWQCPLGLLTIVSIIIGSLALAEFTVVASTVSPLAVAFVAAGSIPIALFTISAISTTRISFAVFPTGSYPAAAVGVDSYAI